jgi:acetyltransferase-like isoleucine patch superfamily enzyme
VPTWAVIDFGMRERDAPWRLRRLRRRGLPAFAAFGPGSRIGWPRTVTAPQRITIGRDVVLGDFTWLAVATERAAQVTQDQGAVPEQGFDPRLVIGDRTTFGRNLTIACLGHVTIGTDVWGGDRILLGDTYHDYRDPHTPIAAQPMAAPRPITIEDGAWLGTGVIVNPGVRVGAGAVIGPGSVVTRDVPARGVVAGSPARVLRIYGEDDGFRGTL